MRHIGARHVLSFFARRGAEVVQGDYLGPWPINREALERITVRLLGLAERCDDPFIRIDLMRIANDLSDVIESHQLHDNSESRDQEGPVLMQRSC